MSDLCVGLGEEVFGPLSVAAKIVMAVALDSVELMVWLNDVTFRAGEIAVAMRIDVDDRAWRDTGNGGANGGACKQTLVCLGSSPLSFLRTCFSEKEAQPIQKLLVLPSKIVSAFGERRGEESVTMASGALLERVGHEGAV